VWPSRVGGVVGHANGNGRPAREPFGQVAVRRGFVTQSQVEDALKAQRALSASGHRHKLIGLVMLELGHLGTTELIEVLKDLNRPLHSAGA